MKKVTESEEGGLIAKLAVTPASDLCIRQLGRRALKDIVSREKEKETLVGEKNIVKET